MTFEQWLSKHGIKPQDYDNYARGIETLREMYSRGDDPNWSPFGTTPQPYRGTPRNASADSENSEGPDLSGYGPSTFSRNGINYERIGSPWYDQRGGGNSRFFEGENQGIYDQEFGWGRRADIGGAMQDHARSTHADDIFSFAPMILGGLATGAALGGFFPGADMATGASIPAGQSGILSQLGMQNPFPDSWGVNPRDAATIDGDYSLVPSGSNVGMGGVGTAANSLMPTSVGGSELSGLTLGAGGASSGAAALGSAGGGASGSPTSLLGSIGSLLTAAGGVGEIAGAIVGAGAAGDASATQAGAAQSGIAEQRRQFDKLVELLSPYRDAGVKSIGGQQDLLGLNGPEAESAAISRLEGSPLYTSLLKSGENAMLQNASATGGLRGGNIQAALRDFRPELLAKVIENQYSKLSGVTGIGANAAALQGNAGMNNATNISKLLEQEGAAVAGGQLAKSQLPMNIGNALTRIGGLASAF